MAIQPQLYETLYLVRPNIKQDDLTTIQDKVTKAINSGQGEISRDEKWAERDLAYPINDYTRGTYYIVEFKAMPSVIANIEKHLAFHNVDVLRFMTVSVEEPSAKTADAPAAEAPKAPVTMRISPGCAWLRRHKSSCETVPNRVMFTVFTGPWVVSPPAMTMPYRLQHRSIPP